MKLLIYGAGVIGSLYAALFGEAGYDVTIYARGRRLELLESKGLLYLQKGKIKRADFVFLSVRENQLYEALEELKTNKSTCIVTLVNSIDDYGKWENICGKGRILPAFPGAGGSIKEDILDAGLTPRVVQPTTFAESQVR